MEDAQKTFEIRPWGRFDIVAQSPQYKIKQIVVLPGKRLSLQKHQFRHEHWYVIQGNGIATVADKQMPIAKGDTIDVPIGVVHRIENTGFDELIFIEIQTGNYFGEDDIVRIEDDFGRVSM